MVRKWPGRAGFYPKSSHTKDSKNGTWYLLALLSNKRYGSRVKWSNPGKGVRPPSTVWCSSYRKGSLLVTLDYGRQLYFIYLYILIYTKMPLYEKAHIYIYIYFNYLIPNEYFFLKLPKPDEVKMILYIAEECGMPCFHLLFTKGQMSIRTAEVRPLF